MADINLHKIFEKLNTKMDRDGSNWAAPSAVVVDSYKNGTEWYRVWSDGWCEQGGYISSAMASNTTTTVTLHHPMKDGNYTITACERYTSGTSDNNNENYWINAAPTTTKFTLYNSAGGYKTLYWRVEGYAY